MDKVEHTLFGAEKLGLKLATSNRLDDITTVDGRSTVLELRPAATEVNSREDVGQPTPPILCSRFILHLERLRWHHRKDLW